MTVYGQLLPDAGEGIIDRYRQAERQEGATVVIGLGGTGTDAILRLKREVFRQLKPDNVDGVVPVYESIRYLVVDSDDAKIRGQVGRITDIDKGAEYFSTAYHYNSVRAVYGSKKIMDNRPELYWLDYEHIDIYDTHCCLGGIRQIGRFALVDRAESFYMKLKSVMEEAMSGAKNGKLSIHICTGLSGGTGSGMFLDVCYLVRKALQELEKPGADVYGYFFLPDVNLSVAEEHENILTDKYLKVNGYAALQELDYCMNFERNKGSFKMNYGFTKIDCDLKPVDLCFLISAMDSAGSYISGGYQNAISLVTDFIIMTLVKGDSIMPDFGNEWLKVRHGACADYHIMGAAAAVMPFSEITACLGEIMFLNFRGIFDRTPTKEECDRFLSGHQLQYEDILGCLVRGCKSAVMFPDDFDVRMYRTSGSGGFESRVKDFLYCNKKELEKNGKAMVRDIGGNFMSPKENNSLIGRIYKGLYDDIIFELDYGIFYAERLLNGCANWNLIHVIESFIERNREELSHAKWQSRMLHDEYNKAKHAMDSAGVLNGRRLLDEYKRALSNLCVNYYRIETLEKMDFILKEYERQAADLEKQFFHVLTTGLNTMREMFAAGQGLSCGVECGNSYKWKPVSSEDVWKELTSEVRKLNPEKTYRDMMHYFFSNCGRWIDRDEYGFCGLMLDFIRNKFGSIQGKSMTGYLCDRFQAKTSAILADRIRTDIIRDRLWADLRPAFGFDPMYQEEILKQINLIVPSNAPEIRKAANDFAGEYGISVRESCAADRISIICFYGGLPLFAYRGIRELEEAYETDKKPGRHLYERGEVNWNEILPSLIPAG